MFRFLLAFTFCFLTTFNAAFAFQWNVDKSASAIKFFASQAGKEFEGRFWNFDSKIFFDPDDLSKTDIEITIDMTSTKTGDVAIDGNLPGSSWFDSANHPKAVYIAKNASHLEGDKYVLHGELTIKGKSKALDLPFALKIDGSSALAEGEATLMRLDYDVGTGSLADDKTASLEVTVKTVIKATR